EAGFTLADNLLGKRVRCKKCQQVFTAQAAAPAEELVQIQAAKPPTPSPADNEPVEAILLPPQAPTQAIVLPGQVPPQLPQLPQLPEPPQLPPQRPGTRREAAPPRPRRRDDRDEPRGNAAVVWAVSGVAAGVLLVVGLVLFLVLRPSSPEPVQQQAQVQPDVQA